MIGEVATYLRIGKELVLPRKKEMYTEDIHDALGKVLETKECFKMVPLYERPPDEESEPTTYDYRARVCKDERFGRLGKVRVLRYHPLTSSTNPAIQVCMRCNVDVSCMDRLPVLPSGWEHLESMDHQSGYGPDGPGTRVAAPCVGGAGLIHLPRRVLPQSQCCRCRFPSRTFLKTGSRRPRKPPLPAERSALPESSR